MTDLSKTARRTAHFPLEAQAGEVARFIRPAGDMWRVDVAGYPCSVRGEEAMRHLERINQQLARMKMALHKIQRLTDVDCDTATQIAREALS